MKSLLLIFKFNVTYEGIQSGRRKVLRRAKLSFLSILPLSYTFLRIFSGHVWSQPATALQTVIVVLSRGDVVRCVGAVSRRGRGNKMVNRKLMRKRISNSVYKKRGNVKNSGVFSEEIQRISNNSSPQNDTENPISKLFRLIMQ